MSIRVPKNVLAGIEAIKVGTSAPSSPSTGALWLDTSAAAFSPQPLDSDLTAIAALAPADGSLMGRSGGAWVGRSPANAKTDLSLDKVLNIKDNYSSAVPPTVSNDSSQGYSVGSRWVDTLTHIAYYCASASVGAALWIKLNFISSVSSPLVESGGGLTLPAAAGPSTDGYLLGADKAKIDALTMYNILDNPGFEKKARSAATFTTSATVTLDRWIMLLGGSSTATVSQITSTIGYPGKSAQIAYTHAAAGYGMIYQTIEEFDQLLGKPITFAVTVKAPAATRVHIYVGDGITAGYSSYNAGTGAERLSVTFTPSVSATALVAAILIDVATATIEVNDATLVVGSYPAAYSPLNASEEQHRCERYYQIILCTARFTASAANQYLEVPLPIRVRMGGTPTATLQADGTITNMLTLYPQVANVTDRGGRFLIGSNAAGDCYCVVRSLVLEWNP